MIRSPLTFTLVRGLGMRIEKSSQCPALDSSIPNFRRDNISQIGSKNRKTKFSRDFRISEPNSRARSRLLLHAQSTRKRILLIALLEASTFMVTAGRLWLVRCWCEDCWTKFSWFIISLLEHRPTKIVKSYPPRKFQHVWYTCSYVPGFLRGPVSILSWLKWLASHWERCWQLTYQEFLGVSPPILIWMNVSEFHISDMMHVCW